jgi:hypothetical protein
MAITASATWGELCFAIRARHSQNVFNFILIC